MLAAMHTLLTRAAAFALTLVGALATLPARAESRGELLYTTHCIACHSERMHWRDQRLATDWASLKALVRRWQGVAQLGWNDDDIVEVARHLNERIYRFPQTSDPVTSMPSSPRHAPFTAASRPAPSMQGSHGENDAGTAPAHPAPVRPAGARGAPEVASSQLAATPSRGGLGSRRG
jgi:hypothetical protein